MALMYSPEEIFDKISFVPPDDSFNLNDIKIICNLARKLPENPKIFEIGTNRGRSSLAWALATGGTVWTVDVKDNRTEVKSYIERLGLKGRIYTIWGSSFKLPWDRKVDCVFIDGDHDYNAVMLDLRKWYNFTDSLICGHDYGHMNFPGVKRAVDEFFFNRPQPHGGIWHAWKSTPLFVLGIARTGTTITAEVLNTHPDINITSESYIISRATNFIETLKTEYPLLEGQNTIRTNSIGDFELIKYHFKNGMRLAIDYSYQSRKYRYYGDKIPNIITTLSSYKSLYPEAKFILTYKNDFEYCYKSVISQIWSVKFSYTREKFQHLWDKSMALIDRSRNNDDIFILDQNLFRSDPKNEMDKISDFLGIDNLFNTSKVRRY